MHWAYGETQQRELNWIGEHYTFRSLNILIRKFDGGEIFTAGNIDYYRKFDCCRKLTF